MCTHSVSCVYASKHRRIRPVSRVCFFDQMPRTMRLMFSNRCVTGRYDPLLTYRIKAGSEETTHRCLIFALEERVHPNSTIVNDAEPVSGPRCFHRQHRMLGCQSNSRLCPPNQ